MEKVEVVDVGSNPSGITCNAGKDWHSIDDVIEIDYYQGAHKTYVDAVLNGKDVITTIKFSQLKGYGIGH